MPPPRSHLSHSAPSRHILWVVISLWLVGVLVGTGALERYSSRPGEDQAAPAQWPAASTLTRGREELSLLVFAHPKCPCTAATVAELARIMATSPPNVTATVIFIQPKGVGESWTQTSLWKAAGEIPGVRRVVDIEGREALRFGAATAGRTLLYAADGQLLFAGGITPSRGHRGDNPGETAVVSLLHGAPTSTRNTPAFGCSLFRVATCRP